MSEGQLERVLREIEGVQVRQTRPRRTRLDLPAETLPALLELLQGRAGYVHLSAISCVDWIEEAQFELVYHLWSYENHNLVSAHIRIPREPGVYLSIYDLYQPAAFFERDIHEMFGVRFEGSPDMAPFILTEWNGPPPMRKEFDSEAYVNEHLNFRDYRPEWLRELEAEGGGVAIRPEEQRFSRREEGED